MPWVTDHRVLSPEWAGKTYKNDIFEVFTQKLLSFGECQRCLTPFNVRLKFRGYEMEVFRCASCGARH